MNILICTDGSPSAEQAAGLLRQLGLLADASVTLLGVSESEGDRSNLVASMERITAALGDVGLSLRQCIRQGHPVDQILVETQENDYGLVVIGWRDDRRLPLIKLGTTATRLARRIQTHLLVVRGMPQSLQRVLFCTGAEAPSVETLRVGGKLIANLPSEVGLLHVMSQVALRTQASEDLYGDAETAIRRNTREGKHLQAAQEELRKVGVQGQIVPRLRHGLVVDEVLAELAEQHYDLLVVGSHHQPGQNRWLGILLDDVTDQLLNRASCSVLIV
ncbi:MAG: universal stress protein [Anaerolineales bacterium]|nr:universal stress protein [Anaerolineales bacterium]